MKRLLLFVIVYLFVFEVASFAQTPERDSHVVELEKTPVKDGTEVTGRPRSLYFLEAYYDSFSGSLEIIHADLGNTEIYILDHYGRIITQTMINSSDYSVEYIELPVVNESYELIITSEVVNAYGLLPIQ